MNADVTKVEASEIHTMVGNFTTRKAFAVAATQRIGINSIPVPNPRASNAHDISIKGLLGGASLPYSWTGFKRIHQPISGGIEQISK